MFLIEFLKLENAQIIISKTIFVLCMEVEKKRVIFGPIIIYYKDPECKTIFVNCPNKKKLYDHLSQTRSCLLEQF